MVAGIWEIVKEAGVDVLITEALTHGGSRPLAPQARFQVENFLLAELPKLDNGRPKYGPRAIEAATNLRNWRTLRQKRISYPSGSEHKMMSVLTGIYLSLAKTQNKPSKDPEGKDDYKRNILGFRPEEIKATKVEGDNLQRLAEVFIALGTLTREEFDSELSAYIDDRLKQAIGRIGEVTSSTYHKMDNWCRDSAAPAISEAAERRRQNRRRRWI